MTTNTICIWYDGAAEAAARFYASVFPDSHVDGVHLAPADYPSGRRSDVITVEFTVVGVRCLGLNGGPAFPQTGAFSFQIATDSQEETDRYWVRSSAMAARKAPAAGARTGGPSTGRSRRASSWRRWPPAALRRSGPSKP
jgi:predicted 3-demethylubiquinone-9 3-methyltransferase (glyoxalase superfamily)